MMPRKEVIVDSLMLEVITEAATRLSSRYYYYY
jgi:hypothetical protein